MEKIRERDLTWQIEEFMICCKSKDLRRKTMQSYEQTLRLFERWCRESLDICTVDEISENDFNLNIPRYVDTFEEEEEVDLAKVKSDIASLEKELVEVQSKMNEYLKELGV